ncbi:MAG: ATP-binding cassette domain-containing protein [Methanoregula sp.]|jgi:molybdate transport system ATP-binding protein|nr:ATP-binding cassette domain-containing protein [Methanoregula sp.]
MLEAVIKKQLRDFSLDLSFSVNDGSIFVLMGENGAGKTTVLNCIAGLMGPDAGSIRFNSSVVFDAGIGINIPVEERRIGFVFQRSAVFPHMTVGENIAFGLRARRKPTVFIKERVGHWLKAMHIEDLVDVKAGNLSGGQKQRVALARALAIEPALLMLDEPFTGLDAENIRLVKELTRTFVTSMKIPCLIVTHRVIDCRDVGDNACIICRGKKEWEGKPENLPGCSCRNDYV